MRSTFWMYLLAALTSIAATSSSLSQAVTDPETGISINPPQGYTAKISKGSVGSSKQIRAAVEHSSYFSQCDILIGLEQAERTLSREDREKQLLSMARRIGAVFVITNERFTHLNAPGIPQ